MRRLYVAVLAFLLIFSFSFMLHLYYNHFKEDKSISISTNPWVGYTPFIYAQEKGWLDDTPFKFLWLVDLTDNAKLYERGFTKGFTATQYELLHFKDYNNISPVFLIDRSYGADAIVSNYTLDELKNTKEPIEVYLEIGSLHDDFFVAFVREYSLEHLQFKKIDASQKRIAHIKLDKTPKIILSYHPYLNMLLNNGYKEIASTKTIKHFFVIDGCYVNNDVLLANRDDFINLKEIFIRAVGVLKSNPKEFYSTIKGYLEGQSYEEFMQTVNQIEWIYDNPSSEIIKYLENQKINTQEIVL